MRIAVHAMTKADQPMAEFEHFRRLEIACGRRDWPCMRSDDPAAWRRWAGAPAPTSPTGSPAPMRTS